VLTSLVSATSADDCFSYVLVQSVIRCSVHMDSVTRTAHFEGGKMAASCV
jgi:hypothetical protein